MWSTQQIKVFTLTFIAYALIHAERKTFSNMKPILHVQWNYSEELMGICDTIFMVCYAVSLLCMGIQVDKFNVVYVLCTGLIGSACSMIVFAFSHSLHIYNNVYVLYCIMGLHGIFQATGWPSCVVLISRYFHNTNQGMTFGVWSSNQCVGNIGGTLLVALLISFDCTIELIFLIPTLALITVAVVILYTLNDRPMSDGYTKLNDNTLQHNDSTISTVELSGPSTPNSTNTYDMIDDTSNNNNTNHINGQLTTDLIKHIDVQSAPVVDATSYPSLSFIQALRVRGVINLSLAHAFVKYVNYTAFFWLPYYLFSELHYSASHSDTMSTLYDIGSIIGSSGAGYLCDRLHVKLPILCLFALLSCGTISLYDTLQSNHTANNLPATSDLYSAVVMFSSGILIGGPAGLIPSACTTDLTNSIELKSSTGTITGIVDGTGSIGGGLGPYFVAYISVRYGWAYVWYCMIISMLCSIAAMSTMLVDDIKLMLGLDKKAQKTKSNVVQPSNKFTAH